MGTVLPIVIAAAAAFAILLIALGLAGGSSVDPVQARLSQLGTMQAKNLEEIELQQPFLDRTLRPLVNRFSGGVSRMSSASFAATTEKRLAMAGNPGELRVADWLGIKAVSSIIFAILFFLLFTFLLGTGPVIGVLIGVAGIAFGYIAPEFWLGRRVSARKHAILLQIPDALDLLTISVRAGLGFDAALGKVLEVQSEQLRIERRQRAEEMANKAPIKMLFPLVGCIFPSLFVVILGPAIILIVKNLAGPGGVNGGG